jgi:hypothetical protein
MMQRVKKRRNRQSPYETAEVHAFLVDMHGRRRRKPGSYPLDKVAEIAKEKLSSPPSRSALVRLLKRFNLYDEWSRDKA